MKHQITIILAVLARACGHDHLGKFCLDDLSSCDEQMHELAGIAWPGELE